MDGSMNGWKKKWTAGLCEIARDKDVPQNIFYVVNSTQCSLRPMVENFTSINIAFDLTVTDL